MCYLVVQPTYFSISSIFSRHSSNMSRLLILQATRCYKMASLIYLQESQIWKQHKRSFWNSCRIIIYDIPKDQNEWKCLQLEIDYNFCAREGVKAQWGKPFLKHQPVRQGQTTTSGTPCPTLCDKKKRKLDSWHIRCTIFFLNRPFPLKWGVVLIYWFSLMKRKSTLVEEAF